MKFIHWSMRRCWTSQSGRLVDWYQTFIQLYLCHTTHILDHILYGNIQYKDNSMKHLSNPFVFHWNVLNVFRMLSGWNCMNHWLVAHQVKNTFEQNSFAQNSFEQNAFEQNTFAQNTFARNTFEQNTFVQNTFEKILLNTVHLHKILVTERKQGTPSSSFITPSLARPAHY